MREINAELWLDCGSSLGEGPVWDEKQNALWFVDIDKGLLMLAYGNGAYKSYDMGQMTGAAALASDGRMLVALEREVCLYSPETGVFETVAVINGKESVRSNDGKCDPMGRFFIGTMAKSNMQPRGALYLIERGKNPRVMLENIGCSNGIAFSPDEKKMYYIDTPEGCVFAFDYEKSTGDISNRRVCVEIARGEGGPDGMTIDTDGCLWVAQWGGWQAARYDPETGKKIMKVNMPVVCASCPAFGGSDYKTLFLTTADKSREQGQSNPGAVFACAPGPQGMRPHVFGV